MTILQDLSQAQLIALVQEQQAKLQKQDNKGTSIKVYGKGVKRVNPAGETVMGKGNVAVYGLQRMPVTLYPAQWKRLADMLPEVLATIEANKAILSWDKNGD
jgi:hypothetical protein